MVQWIFGAHLIGSWYDFEQGIKNHFGPTSFDNPKVALSRLSQSFSVVDYNARFEKLMSSISDFDEDTLVTLYIAGLKLEIKEELLFNTPQRLFEAMNMARAQEKKITRRSFLKRIKMRILVQSFQSLNLQIMLLCL